MIKDHAYADYPAVQYFGGKQERFDGKSRCRRAEGYQKKGYKDFVDRLFFDFHTVLPFCCDTAGKRQILFY